MVGYYCNLEGMQSPACHRLNFNPLHATVSYLNFHRLEIVLAAPDGSFVSNPGRDGYLACWLSYTVLKRYGVYSATYGTVHYKEPLKSFEIIVGHSPGFGLPSVAILP